MYVFVSAAFLLFPVSVISGMGLPLAPGLGYEVLMNGMEFMQKYDYIQMDAGKGYGGGGLNLTMVKAGVERFQTFYGLSKTGVMDSPTAGLMDLPRCGCRDPEFANEEERNQFSYGVEGGKWNKTELTFRITRIPNKMSKKTVRRTVKDACRVWSNRSPLKFSEIRSGKADINIQFIGTMNHGDSRPFWHPMGEVAHGYPPTDRDMPGEIHLDASENYVLGNDRNGINLHQLVVHEIGHTLGLGHSPDPQSVMYPILQPRDSADYDLSVDDLTGLHDFYGRKNRHKISSPRSRKSRQRKL